MRKLLTAILCLLVTSPVLAATQAGNAKSVVKPAVQNTAPNKYEIGKYNFNVSGEGVMVEAAPASELQTQEQSAQPQNDVPAVKTQTPTTVQTKTEPAKDEEADSEEEFESLRNQTDIVPDYLQQKSKNQSRIINQIPQSSKTEIKTNPETGKREIITTEEVTGQQPAKAKQNVKNSETNSKKTKANEQSKTEKKFDPNKPPVKFMIVPVQYKGESKRTIERINE